MTIQQLFERLGRLPKDATVGVRILDYDDNDPQHYDILGFMQIDDGDVSLIVDMT